jgi:hypothetical protein
MKLLVNLLLFFYSVNLFSQESDYKTHALIGVNSLNFKTYNSSNKAISLGLSYSYFFIEGGSNLNFNFDNKNKVHSFDINDITTNIYSKTYFFNFGINNVVDNGLYITPYIGLAYSEYILELKNNNYIYINKNSKINFGILIKKYLSDNLGLAVGIGYIDNFKLCIIFK